MKTKKILQSIVAGTLMASSIAMVSHAEISVSGTATTDATVTAPAPATAPTTRPTGAASASVHESTAVSVKTKKEPADKLAAIISRGDEAITKRISDLTALSTRVQGLKNVSDSEKQSIAADVQANISSLTSLKAKLDADTDVTTAMTDAKSIAGSFRIYMLVVPQGHILAAADRVTTIVSMMTTVQTKLQTRLDADKAAGKDVSAQVSQLATVSASLSDASAKAQAAQSGVATLKPDQGDKTVQASNTAALKSARANIKTAAADLQTARKTLKSIVESLK